MSHEPKLVKCSICGEEFELCYSTYRTRVKKHPVDTKFYCKKCKNIGRSLDLKEIQNNLTEEERDKRRKENSERAKKQWASYDDKKHKEISEIFSKAKRAKIDAMSPEELAEFKKSASERSILAYKNKSEEEREAFRKYSSERAKKVWANMSKEQRDSIRKKQSDGLKRYINSLSPDEKIIHDNRLLDHNKNLSDEEKKSISIKLKASASNRIKNMTDEELNERMDKLHKGFKKYFSNPDNVEEFSRKMKYMHSKRSDESKIEFSRKIKAWYNSLSPESKAEYNRSRFINSLGTRNSLMMNFEKMFSESNISEKFYIIHEFSTFNEENTHSWDYGIFNKNEELVMLVDIDGAYYHADLYDYDGIHSREEYDSIRWKTIPKNVIPAIIQEFHFLEGFKRMENLLTLTYDEYCEKIFKECRLIPFPQPKYLESDLIKSWDSIIRMKLDDIYHSNFNINPRLGDRLILEFHQSIYYYKKNSKLSVYDIWKNDKLLKEAISQNVLYQSYLNKNKMLQSFINYDKGPRPKIFSAALARMILYKYCKTETSVFDPFAEYSGRLLGSISGGYDYTGIYDSVERYNEANLLVEFLESYSLNKSNAKIYKGNISEFSGDYQLLFTCPPPNDAYVENYNLHTQDYYIDECIKLFKCKKYIFIVSNTEKYKDKIIDVINGKYDKSEYKLILIQ